MVKNRMHSSKRMQMYKKDVPEDAPPSPMLRHRMVCDMEAVGEAKAAQASEDAAKKLEAAEDRVQELESEITRMTEGVSALEGRIADLTVELDKSEDARTALSQELSAARAEAESRGSLLIENDNLRSRIAALDADRISVEDLKHRLALSEDQRNKAMSMLNEAEDRLAEYKMRISAIRAGAEARRDGGATREGTAQGTEARREPESVRVTRTDRNCLSSPMFNYRCYSVKMNVDKTTMLITPSNDGKVLCRDYVLEISGLGHLLSFNGTEDLRAETVVGTRSIKITLGDSS